MKQVVASTPLRSLDRLGARPRNVKYPYESPRVPFEQAALETRECSQTGFDQKPGSNMRKTIKLPKESETSFVKFVRGGG